MRGAAPRESCLALCLACVLVIPKNEFERSNDSSLSLPLRVSAHRHAEEQGCAAPCTLRVVRAQSLSLCHLPRLSSAFPRPGTGGKNRRRGKNEGDEKRELVFKEDGQGTPSAEGGGAALQTNAFRRPLTLPLAPPLRTQSTRKCCACLVRPLRLALGSELGLVLWAGALKPRACPAPRQRPPRGAVHRRHQAPVPHPWQDAQEGVGQHGTCSAHCVASSLRCCTPGPVHSASASRAACP